MKLDQKLSVSGVVAVCLFFLSFPVQGQEPTVGLIVNGPGAYSGYTLFAPKASTITYLINNEGQIVHSWGSDYLPGNTVYLLENGDLLRTGYVTGSGGSGGMILRIAWDGTVQWAFPYHSSDHLQHHDIRPLPNGNVLILAWEFLSAVDAIQAGRDPATLADAELWPEKVVEVSQTGPTTGEIVWEWHLWDHLIQEFDPSKDNFGIVADHPELVDVNFRLSQGSDWIHANGLDYNPDLDQILISAHHFNEFWIIDHSTTPAQAASHEGGNQGSGGDLLYRWGNPQTYQAGDEADRRLFRLHGPMWIKNGNPGAGNIILFNNGVGRPEGIYSTVDEIPLPVDGGGTFLQPPPGVAYGPTDLAWTFLADPPEDLYSPFLSGAQRLPNGNTLICEGASGRFLEIQPDGAIVWEYVNPVGGSGNILQGQNPSGNLVFRCERVAPDHPGLIGQDLTPQGRLERYPISLTHTDHSPLIPTVAESVNVQATVVADSGLASVRVMVDEGAGFYAVEMFDDGAHNDGSAGDGDFAGTIPPINAGIVRYYVAATDNIAGVETDPVDAPGTTYTYFLTACCLSRVGDANGQGGDEPTISDVTTIVDAVFLSGDFGVIACLSEADLNQSGGSLPQPTDVTIADISVLIDYLFITGSSLGLADCL